MPRTDFFLPRVLERVFNHYARNIDGFFVRAELIQRLLKMLLHGGQTVINSVLITHPSFAMCIRPTLPMNCEVYYAVAVVISTIFLFFYRIG
jgi:hypothetical protein